MQRPPQHPTEEQKNAEKRSATFFPSVHSKSAALLAMPILCAGVLTMAQTITPSQDLTPVATTVNVETDSEATIETKIDAAANAEISDGDMLDANQASNRTRKDARTMTLSIPAPRGQITDRFGYPFAQNNVVWYPAIQMKQFEDESDAYILKWTRERLAKADEVFGIEITASDEEILEHYKHRRWLPMPFKHVVNNSSREKIEAQLMDGLILHPIYQRLYPQKSSAAHIIGYVGSKSRNLEVGPINYGDPLFWEMKGRGGLEKLFNEELTGKNGKRKLQYNSQGKEVRREDIPPEPGGTVVTTIDMEWQQRAERVLATHCKRGAFVVIDIETGEVLVLASRPSYDLNLRVPYLKQEDLDMLLNDPGKPLYARAFQGEYPPASAFKVVTGMAALENGAVTQHSTLECPAYIQLGNIKMYDWSRRHRGRMNIVQATTLSNNPFFIQAALATERRKSGEFMNLASRLGYGTRTGLPLEGESPGSILTEEYAQRRFGRGVKQGDIANASIGQGAILATPLQVAQSMAGVANGGVLPKLHLIKQLQNAKGVITMASKPTDRNKIKISAKTVGIIQEGMYKVVNAANGTGKRAALSYSVLCGKTGTAQWGPASKEQRLAWFAGFFPLDQPKYAFAVLYEGAPHEKVSGGKMAGPMVPAFFNPLEDEAVVRHQLSQKALIIPDDEVTALDAAPKVPGKAVLVDEIEEPDGEIPKELPLEAPRALIVEDDPVEMPAVEPIDPEAPLDPSNPMEPAEPAIPSEPAPARAIPVEDDDPNLPQEPEQPIEPDNPQDPDAPPLRDLPIELDPLETPPADPADEPKPPKAIPVE
ncbi:MAG: penicillin-binding transpeptidase domain-containing protein [Akkermansiaceae bacterium]